MKQERLMVILVCLVLITTVVFSGCGSSSTPPAAQPTAASAPATGATTAAAATTGSTASVAPTAAAAAAQPAGAVTELKFATHQPEQHHVVQNIYKPWAKEVETQSKGALKVTVYPGETLAKADQQFDMVRTGAIDIAVIVPTHNPGKFNLMDIFQLPGLIPVEAKDKASGRLVQDLVFEKYLTQMYLKDVKVLWLGRYPLNELHTKKAIRTMEDLKGQIIATPGGKIMPPYITGLGGKPEAMPTSDMYTALERNTVQGIVLPLETQLTFKWYEVGKFVTLADAGSSCRIAIMNTKKWDSLNPEQQKALTASISWATERELKDFMDSDAQTMTELPKKGVEIIKLSDAEKARWQKVGDEASQAWLKEFDGQGLPATKLFNDVKQWVGQ